MLMMNQHAVASIVQKKGMCGTVKMIQYAVTVPLTSLAKITYDPMQYASITKSTQGSGMNEIP